MLPRIAGRETRIMWDVRGLRGRGRSTTRALVRPDRPRRWTLPITALRVMPPSSAAIWLAERPSDQSFLSCSTRSSVQRHRAFSCPAADCLAESESSSPGSLIAADATHTKAGT